MLSEGKKNKKVVYKLSKKGQELNSPEDVLKEPYVFEFLDIKETKPILEKDLERKLVRHMEDFLLELGKGFMFVGTQQRITLGNIHYYVDMVFYDIKIKLLLFPYFIRVFIFLGTILGTYNSINYLINQQFCFER